MRGAMAGGSGGRKGKKRGTEAASSSSTREQQQEAREKEMAEAVRVQMLKVQVKGSGFDAHLKKALEDAGMRSKLMLEKQCSVETLPRFELDMHCTEEEMDLFFDDRAFRFQLVASLGMLPGVVVTPPHLCVLYHLIEIVRKVKDENGQLVYNENGSVKKISVMQFVVNEYNNYFAAFRPTPVLPKKPYDPGDFFTFKNKQIKLPDFFGRCLITGHREDYTDVEQVELRAGFLELMVQNLLDSFTQKNYKLELSYRIPFVEAPMLFFGECQRSRVVRRLMRGKTGLLTEPLDLSSDAKIRKVTTVIDALIHKWSKLSKVGLWLFAAILELQLGLEQDALFCFIKGRVKLRAIVTKMGRSGLQQVVLQVYDDNGVFCLKRLLGQYLALLMYQEQAVLRCVMRERLGFYGRYDRLGSKEDNSHLMEKWNSPDADKDYVESGDVTLPYRDDKVEWQRWLRIKAQLRGQETLLGKMME